MLTGTASSSPSDWNHLTRTRTAPRPSGIQRSRSDSSAPGGSRLQGATPLALSCQLAMASPAARGRDRPHYRSTSRSRSTSTATAPAPAARSKKSEVLLPISGIPARPHSRPVQDEPEAVIVNRRAHPRGRRSGDHIPWVRPAPSPVAGRPRGRQLHGAKFASQHLRLAERTQRRGLHQSGSSSRLRTQSTSRRT